MNKDLHKYSDAELLSFYRRTRKPDYLIGLYERYMPLVYGVALKYLKNVPDAQDAVMQIWEELFEKYCITIYRYLKPGCIVVCAIIA